MPADASSPAMQLMLAMFHELMEIRLTKADFTGIMDRTLDFYSRPFSVEELAGWPGKILLVLAEDDPASPERVRDAFRQLYPQAEWKLFRGTGHTTSVTNQAEYQAVMDEFLRKQN
jgi:pimeloyl-ACP methyl ester carboxylesterase